MEYHWNEVELKDESLILSVAYVMTEGEVAEPETGFMGVPPSISVERVYTQDSKIDIIDIIDEDVYKEIESYLYEFHGL